MTLYQLMQLSPAALKGGRKRTADPAEKRRYTRALWLRNICLLSFAIAYISVFSALFGPENNSVAVASLCMLLGIKFVPFGYHIKDSVIALGAILTMMGLASNPSWQVHPWFAFIGHFVFLLLTLIMVVDDPIMGNAGLYAFSFIFISMTPVSGHAATMRWAALAFAFTLCSAVMVHKHFHAHRSVRFQTVLSDFSLTTIKGQWQLRLAFGVALALLIAQLLQLAKPMWLGYATMSVLLPHTGAVTSRATQRALGAIIGTIAFTTTWLLLPPDLRVFIGPAAGLGLGFSASYFMATVFNSFGGLYLATITLGLNPAFELRLGANISGAVLAIGLAVLMHQLWVRAGVTPPLIPKEAAEKTE